jgi:DNA repair protein RAD50
MTQKYCSPPCLRALLTVLIKFSGESEILAMVKMSFETQLGAQCIISRRILLTVKRSVRSQKALEGNLVIKDTNGSRESISGKTAQLDEQVPKLLGVSKAILESVVFCHQDESLWPMSTPTMLKKKFDEIFEAQKYTKAVENLKMIRKQHMDILKDHHANEKIAKDDKEKGARADARMNALAKELNHLEEQYDQLTESIKEASTRSTEAFENAARYGQIVNKLAHKRAEAEIVEDNLNTNRANMKEMDNTDEELREMQEQYDRRLSLLTKKKEDLVDAYRLNQDEIEQNNKQLGNSRIELGSAQKAKNDYENQLAARLELVKEISHLHNIRGFEFGVTDDRIPDFSFRLSKLKDERAAAAEESRQNLQAKLSQAEAVLHSLKQRRADAEKEKETHKTNIARNDTSISNFLATINGLDVDEGRKSVLESAVQDTERRLADVKTHFAAENYTQQLREMEDRITALREKSQRLGAERRESSQHAEEIAQLKFVSDEIKARHSAIKSNEEHSKADIQKVLQDKWTTVDLEKKYKVVVEAKARTVKDAESKRGSLQRDLDQLQYKLTDATKIQETTKTQIAEHRESIKAVIEDDPSEYLNHEQELEEQYNNTQNDFTAMTHLHTYYEACFNLATEQSKCKLCDRKIDGPEKSRFVKRLEVLVHKAQQQLQDEVADELKKELEEVKALQPKYHAWVRLRGELPEISTAVKKLEQERDELNSRLDAADQRVNMELSVQQDIDAIARVVQNISKAHQEAIQLEAKLKSLQDKQNLTGSFRPVSEIDTLLNEASSESDALSASANQIRSAEKHALGQISALEIDVRDSKQDLDRINRKLEQKATLTAQVAEAKDQSAKCRDSIGKVESALQDLNSQVPQAQSEVEEVLRRGIQQNKQNQDEIGALRESEQRLSEAKRQIDLYVDTGGPDALPRISHDIESTEKTIHRLQVEAQETTKEVKKLELELGNYDSTKQAIAANISYRESKKRLEGLVIEITELEKHNVQADLDRQQNEGEKWLLAHNRLAAEQAGVSGTRKSKHDQYRELEEEYDKFYKGATSKYKEARVKVEVTKAGIEDLGRYASALDKAIMKYHSVKMDEINRIIAELWQKTYKGTDVDTIMIRSENESQKGNKSYNYRVVMVKADTEMDMRGRCSAGQKVLASIIIRLALAECFGVSCGLIALDEPTTNLDAKNIRALARSLSDLISARRAQSNFQLIIITHDEDFLRQMNCAEFADQYYHVRRNEEQKSEIKLQSISKVL